MPIEILQKEVQVRDPTTHQFSDLTALRGGQGPAGPGVPAGGTDGDVLVKNGATDYDATWKKTPPQMGSLAYIEQTSTVSKQDGYQFGEYLVYNGQLYKVTASTITQSQTLDPTPGSGNIEAVTVSDAITVRMCDFTYNNATFSFVRYGPILVCRVNSAERVTLPSAWTNIGEWPDYMGTFANLTVALQSAILIMRVSGNYVQMGSNNSSYNDWAKGSGCCFIG